MEVFGALLDGTPCHLCKISLDFVVQCTKIVEIGKGRKKYIYIWDYRLVASEQVEKENGDKAIDYTKNS
jgi:hypothetical protein